MDGKRKQARLADIQVILNTNPNYTETTLRGPADIAIEIVSLESVQRDHGIKFRDYESGGVKEYWIIDPLRREARLYCLDNDGVFQPQSEDSTGNYTTPQLPDFKLHIPTLWQTTLPSIMDVMDTMREMLKTN